MLLIAKTANRSGQFFVKTETQCLSFVGLHIGSGLYRWQLQLRQLSRHLVQPKCAVLRRMCSGKAVALPLCIVLVLNGKWWQLFTDIIRILIEMDEVIEENVHRPTIYDDVMHREYHKNLFFQLKYFQFEQRQLL